MKQIKGDLSILMALTLLLSSCIGVQADISLRPDGSGTMVLEYRFSRMLASLGELDGNERRLPVPLGKADFERTQERVPGLRLVSFSSQEDETDRYHQVKMEFADPAVLVRFLDATGQRASLVQEQGKYRLTLAFTQGMDKPDPDLLALLEAAAAGYDLTVNLSFSGEGSLRVYDREGRPWDAVPGMILVSQGKQVSFTAPLGAVLTRNQGLYMEIGWQPR
ncbi:MAG: hypothetical protein LBP88_03620 [Treponema sp.]|jgi:hypothetical protein|nr:hypothetical protein [Treponema sp.]